MARPKKKGLDYFPLDCGFIMDSDMRALRGQFGNDALAIYLYIISRAYQDEGYFLRWTEDELLLVAADLNISEEKTRAVLSSLLRRSLLTEVSTLAGVNALTSSGIQRRFQEAVKARRNLVEVDSKVWLLQESETLECIKFTHDDGFSGNNQGFSRNNSNKSGKNATKQRRVKESKVKQSKGETDVSPERTSCVLAAADRERLVSVYGEELVARAVADAQAHNAVRVPYIEAILRRIAGERPKEPTYNVDDLFS